MRKCLVCEKGNLMEVDDIILEIRGYVFIVRGERCNSCNEEFLDEEETQKTISIARNWVFGLNRLNHKNTREVI